MLRSLALAVTALALVAAVGGCAKFDKEFGQQWVVVTFAPNTSVATARHVASACSHVPNLPVMGKVKADTGEPGVVDEVDFNSTNATDGELSELQQCLQKFPKIVQGFTQMDQGDS